MISSWPKMARRRTHYFICDYEKDVELTTDLINKIKQHIRQNTTPRHVPAKIIAMSDLPRTKNNKLTETTVRDIIHGKEIKNKEALLNPDCLVFFTKIAELQTD